RVGSAELRRLAQSASACETELRLRRIDTLHLGRRAALDQLAAEGAAAAADIDPSPTRLRRQPVEKDVGRKTAPDPHHPLIGGAVLEADLRLSHSRPRSPRLAAAGRAGRGGAVAEGALLGLVLVEHRLGGGLPLGAEL